MGHFGYVVTRIRFTLGFSYILRIVSQPDKPKTQYIEKKREESRQTLHGKNMNV